MPSTPTKTIEDLDEQPWASPMLGENAAWFQRFSLYAAMGAARSVRAVYNAELAQRNSETTQIVHGQHSKAVPSSWSRASHRFEWQRRAEAFDAWRRAQVFSNGNAQDTERIKKLDGLIEKLSEKCLAMIDLIDIAEADVEKLAKLATALMSAIDLMAKHTGGYVAQRIEHTGKDGKAIEVHSEEETKLKVFFYMPQVDALEDIAGPGALADAGEQGDEQ